ncbi:MAG: flagellar filament capping protein FliD [Verrucomicrobia bacterium]|nr:flagellar filament capping protein FliD [Verrucomicrobiota bacterium]
MADLGVSGLASGFDWRSLVDQLTNLERAPEQRLQSEQSKLQQRNAGYANLQTQLSALKTRVDALKDPALFGRRATASGDSTVASATVSAGTALGSYAFSFTQLATAAAQQGAGNAGAALSATNNVSGLGLSSAGFAAPISAGIFTVNGKQITVAAPDTLQQVFDNISTATNGAVTGSYDAATDKISLTSASPIVLGTATDTSNFLQVAQLNNNGTGSILSSAALGAIKSAGTLNSANFSTPVSDGGAGTGAFMINGVTINFNAASDSVANVLARINNSTAGVTASYDASNDRFTLTNKTTGDVGIALQDVTGNFLAATKLSGGSLQRGSNLLYTINGGSQLVSQSNTLTEASSGITGLSVTALKQGGSTTINVTSDAANIKTAIADFVTEYNKTQSLIDSYTASTTDAKGKVTASIFSNDGDTLAIAQQLRSSMTADVTGLSGTLKRLEALGYSSNGTDNSLALKDATKLDAVLANNLNDVKDIFSDSANGLATKLSTYLDNTIGTNGSLVTKQSNITKSIADLNTQISDQERFVLARRDQLISSFVAMESASAKSNQQLQFLQKRFG